MSGERQPVSCCVIDAPVGHLLIEADEGGLLAVERTDRPLSLPDTPLLTETVRQLCAYFDGTLTDFALPLHMVGTPFQLRCWAALLAIPYGETISYGEQARRIGQPKASRAVGGANHRNRLCIVVPCHRVVGASGALTGYGGGMDMKEWLLRHEREVIHRK